METQNVRFNHYFMVPSTSTSTGFLAYFLN